MSSWASRVFLGRAALALAVSGLALPALGAQEVSLPALFPSARAAAMGGDHAALPGGFNSLFTNPSSFALEKGEFSAAELTAVVSGPVFAMVNAMSSADPMAALSGLLSDPFHTALDLGGPLALGYVGKGLGLGLLNRSYVSVDAPNLASVRAYVSEDIVLAAGYGFKIPLGGDVSVEIGILAKGFVRGSYTLDDSLMGLFTLLSSPDPTASLMAEPFDLTVGVGADLGLGLSLGRQFRVAVTYLDAFTPTYISKYAHLSDFIAGGAATAASGAVAPRLNAGILWAPDLGELDTYVSSFKLMADYSDILSLFALLPRNWILNLSAGAELRLLDILSLRAGLREGYLSAGVGVDLSVFKIDLAMFGRELGREPGQIPLFNMAIGLEFRY